MSSKSNPTLPKIAIVEDEEDLRASMVDYLSSYGYPVWAVESAEAFYKQLLVSPIDVVVLDIGLPGESGLQVAHHLHELGSIEIIIVSGRSSVEDRIEGLSHGASRYLIKPIDMRELVANIKSSSRVLEKLNMAAGIGTTNQWTLQRADWVLLTPEGTPINLTTREFTFIDCLLKGDRQAASRTELAYALSNGKSDGFDYHRIDMIVTRLRQKIAAKTTIKVPIKTEQGIGFMFTAECRVV